MITLPIVALGIAAFEASTFPPSPGYCGNSLVEIVVERGVPLMFICWGVAIATMIVNFFRDQLGTFD